MRIENSSAVDPRRRVLIAELCICQTTRFVHSRVIRLKLLRCRFIFDRSCVVLRRIRFDVFYGGTCRT